MSKTSAQASVVKTVRVKASPERAFAVFVDSFGAWWPKNHAIGKSPLANAVIEPLAGGRFYEIGTDGGECDWGRVREIVPGEKLVLDWQLNADWQYDPDFEVPVTVTFTADGEDTIVQLEHGELQRYGARAAEVAASISGDGGWPFILSHYQARCAGS